VLVRAKRALWTYVPSFSPIFLLLLLLLLRGSR
jgi:hypothetical protein